MAALNLRGIDVRMAGRALAWHCTLAHSTGVAANGFGCLTASAKEPLPYTECTVGTNAGLREAKRSFLGADVRPSASAVRTSAPDEYLHQGGIPPAILVGETVRPEQPGW